MFAPLAARLYSCKSLFVSKNSMITVHMNMHAYWRHYFILFRLRWAAQCLNSCCFFHTHSRGTQFHSIRYFAIHRSEFHRTQFVTKYFSEKQSKAWASYNVFVCIVFFALIISTIFIYEMMMSIWLNLTQLQLAFIERNKNEKRVKEKKRKKWIWTRHSNKVEGDATKRLMKTIRIKLEDFHSSHRR